MKINFSRGCLLSLSSLCMIPVCSHAAIINIDVGRSSSTTAGADINNLTLAGNGATLLENGTISVADLVDTLGNATGFSIELEAVGGNVGLYNTSIANAFTGPYDSAITDVIGVQPVSALGDGFNLIGDDSPTITLSGLDSSLTYDVIIYNARGAGTGGAWDYTTTDGNGTQVLSDAQILQNDEVTVFSGLIPDTNGEITTVFTKDGNARGGLNFIQVVTVPEPSSTILLGMGGLALLRRRRA